MSAQVNAVHRPPPVPASQPRERTVHTLLLAHSISLRLTGEPDRILFADVVRVDERARVVVLAPWGWRRRKLAVEFDLVLSAVPSSVPTYAKQLAIGAEQRPLEGDPLWPPR